jgi:hypothetical protein
VNKNGSDGSRGPLGQATRRRKEYDRKTSSPSHQEVAEKALVDRYIIRAKESGFAEDGRVIMFTGIKLRAGCRSTCKLSQGRILVCLGRPLRSARVLSGSLNQRLAGGWDAAGQRQLGRQGETPQQWPAGRDKGGAFQVMVARARRIMGPRGGSQPANQTTSHPHCVFSKAAAWFSRRAKRLPCNPST